MARIPAVLSAGQTALGDQQSVRPDELMDGLINLPGPTSTTTLIEPG